MSQRKTWALGLMGLLLIATGIEAWLLGDLRQHTIAFEYLFFSAFLLYGIACLVVLGMGREVDRRLLTGLVGIALLVDCTLVLTRPTLSDDMYRYVWDGRVQAQGISPYHYPPDAAQVAFLRDRAIYPSINRPDAVTIYPPAAEAAFALLWRIWPENIHWFQAVTACGGLVAGILLMFLLHDLGLSPARALIYLWSPLLAFETAHSAHVDGLVLPFLVGAWWARTRERDALTGLLLGIATALKLYPALLLPFLWRPDHPRGRWLMPMAFALTLAGFYLPYTLVSGLGVLGYLPLYLPQKFNISPLASALTTILGGLKLGTLNLLIPLALGIIVIVAVWSIARPAQDAETALRRCLLPIGVITLLSQNLFSWYMLWLLPLVAIFLAPSGKTLWGLALPRLDTWTGWWLFCGLIGLSYTFFINWTPVTAAIQAQFFPLYALLIFGFLTSVWTKYEHRLRQALLRQKPD